jgi:hypothetical protein
MQDFFALAHLLIRSNFSAIIAFFAWKKITKRIFRLFSREKVARNEKSFLFQRSFMNETFLRGSSFVLPPPPDLFNSYTLSTWKLLLFSRGKLSSTYKNTLWLFHREIIILFFLEFECNKKRKVEESKL